MKIIFCHDPMSTEAPDSMYIDEVAAATHAGLNFELIDYAALANHDNAARAVRDIPAHDSVELAIYRGWLLSVSQYSALYNALMSRGIRLINTADHYQYTQHLPKALPLIKEHTPRTIYMETDGQYLSYDGIMQLLIPFAGQPIILKDFVKSAKHYWYEACYISSASELTTVKTTVENFLKIRGDDFEGGLVFREFVDFKALADHPQSQMPLIKEFRLFFLNGIRIATMRYWDIEGYDDDDLPPNDLFADLAKRVKSHFFTMDVAQRPDGEWMIVELGDGQVSGLPDTSNRDDFYRSLAGIG
ncbi:MAG: ATP-grasp domain-containing protein [Phototrophicaceae bacterium]